MKRSGLDQVDHMLDSIIKQIRKDITTIKMQVIARAESPTNPTKQLSKNESDKLHSHAKFLLEYRKQYLKEQQEADKLARSLSDDELSKLTKDAKELEKSDNISRSKQIMLENDDE